jgi:hypothetical protein
MLRQLYRWIIRLHPARFRDRFGQEMLSIFDNATEDLAGSKLLTDGVMSLLRQWMLRSHYPAHSASEAVPWSADGAPVFYIFDDYKPRTSSLVSGGMLTIALFCAVWLISEYTWTHPVFMPLVTVQFNTSSDLNSLTNSPVSPLPLTATGSPSREVTLSRVGAKQTGRFSEPESAPSRNTSISTPATQTELSPVVIASKANEGTETSSAASAKSTATAAPQAASTASAEPTAAAARAVVAPIAAEPLRAYAGTYRTDPPLVLAVTVTVENGELAIRIPGESKTTLALLDGMKFKFVDAQRDWVQFVKPSHGPADKLIICRNGRFVTAHRDK